MSAVLERQVNLGNGEIRRNIFFSAVPGNGVRSCSTVVLFRLFIGHYRFSASESRISCGIIYTL